MCKSHMNEIMNEVGEAFTTIPRGRQQVLVRTANRGREQCRQHSSLSLGSQTAPDAGAVGLVALWREMRVRPQTAFVSISIA